MNDRAAAQTASRARASDSSTPLGRGLWWQGTRYLAPTLRGLKQRGYQRGCHSIGLMLLLISGCHRLKPSSPSPTTSPIVLALADGLTPPITDQVLKATVTPPLGWKPDPLKSSDRHRHQVWVSPTGDTAFGVIYFDLPLPISADLALWGFLKEMKNTEGEANLIFKHPDDTLPGLRFVAEGGPYRIRCKLQVDGFHGWVVYAGTLRARPINPLELKTAENAREQTHVDLP